MKIIKQNQLGKYLFWLGPFLVTVGLTTGLVSGQWGIVGLLFIITGTIISGLWVVWQGRQTKWWNRRSTQVGTNALVSIVAVLVILGLV